MRHYRDGSQPGITTAALPRLGEPLHYRSSFILTTEHRHSTVSSSSGALAHNEKFIIIILTADKKFIDPANAHIWCAFIWVGDAHPGVRICRKDSLGNASPGLKKMDLCNVRVATE